MPLSRANCATRVPSRNQRSTTTACARQFSARRPARVPRRRRSTSSSPARYSAVTSLIGRIAVYVMLTMRRTSMKLIFGRTYFIPGFCAFSLHPTTSGVSAGHATHDAATGKGSVPGPRCRSSCSISRNVRPGSSSPTRSWSTWEIVHNRQRRNSALGYVNPDRIRPSLPQQRYPH